MILAPVVALLIAIKCIIVVVIAILLLLSSSSSDYVDEEINGIHITNSLMMLRDRKCIA